MKVYETLISIINDEPSHEDVLIGYNVNPDTYQLPIN